MSPRLRVHGPGLMTTVQDLGRHGYQRLGIPVSGAIDSVALRIANLIVGNPQGTAGLEMAYQGPTLEAVGGSVRVAVAGADAPIEIIAPEPRRIPPLTSVTVKPGERFCVGPLRSAAVCYLAIEGGITLAAVMGSRSTYVRAGLGGFKGRPLAAGDELPVAAANEGRSEQRIAAIDLAPPPRIRLILGPQDDYFTPGGIETLLTARYGVAAASDRMGMRLDGPPIEHAKGYNIVSDGIAPGAIQVPGSGQPIVLLADRQTTGGYPKIATVISADLPALGRLMPGAHVMFEPVTLRAAEAARRDLDAWIAALPSRLEPADGGPGMASVERLLDANLVSGVVDANTTIL